MTVNELIAELRKEPSEARVVMSGYEEGFDDISRLTSISIARKPNAKEYEGRWQDKVSGEAGTLLFGRGRDQEA